MGRPPPTILLSPMGARAPLHPLATPRLRIEVKQSSGFPVSWT